MKSYLDGSSSSAKANFVLAAPDEVHSVELSGTAVSFTVPAGARHVVFSATDTFAAAYDGTAALPTSTAVTNGAGSELNPAVRLLDDVTSISVIGSCQITLSFYA